MKLKLYLYIYLIGAVVYSAIEVAFKGSTHWTMTLTGGLVFLLIYIVNKNIKSRSLLLRCLLSALIITSLEFSVGVIVNLILNWNVWDYSERPFDILGQICPMFSSAWFLLSIPVTYLALLIEEKLSPDKIDYSGGGSRSKRLLK